MKKIISLLAACAMLLTMLGAVAVQATPYAEYPYIYEDLENGVPAGFGLLSNSTGAVHKMVADPTGRSGYVYKVSIDPAKSGNQSFVSAVKNQNIPIVMGQQAKTSLMLYMATGVPAATNLSIVFNLEGTTLDATGAKSEQKFKGWYEIPMNITWTLGNWVKVEGTVDWSSNLAYGVSGSTPLGGHTIDYDSITMYQLYFRIGNAQNTSPIITADALVDGATTFDFYFDEMTYEPYAEGTFTDVAANYNKLTFSTFDSPYADGNGFNAGYSFEGCSISSGNTAPEAYPGSGAYLKMKANNQQAPRLRLNGGKHASIIWQANHTYELSFYTRVNSVSGDDKTLSLGIGPHTGVNQYIADVNGFATAQDWPFMVAADVIDASTANWQKITINFVFEFKTFAELIRNGSPMTLNILPFVGTNYWAPITLDMDFDDLIIKDLGPITNGDFETGAGTALKSRSANGNPTGNATLESYSVFGWNAASATVSQSTDVRANADTGSTKSMRVAINAGGYAWQGLALEKSETNRYKLSFWAKGDFEDGVEKDFALVLDRKADTVNQAAEYYYTPTQEFYTGKNAVLKCYNGQWLYDTAYRESDAQQWKLTNEWQYYETYIDINFPAIEGHESVDTTYIKPRLPYMYYVVDGGNPAGTVYYLDDMKLENAPEEMPEASNLVVNGVADPGKTVSVSYDFANPFGNAEGASIVRVYADGATLGSFKARGGSFTIPEIAIGKTLTFELLPVDTAGNAGAIVGTSDMATTDDWTKMYIENSLDAARVYAGKAMSGKLIFAAYNGKELTSVDIVDVDITAADTLTSVATSKFDLTDATKIKVMFWDGVENIIPLGGTEEATVPAA